jgi:hypothetical protein
MTGIGKLKFIFECLKGVELGHSNLAELVEDFIGISKHLLIA